MANSVQKSYSFLLAHLRENQRLHLLGVGVLVIVFLLMYGCAWPGQVVWLSAAALGMVLPFSLFYRSIERASWPIENRFRRLLQIAFLQGWLDILLITLFMHHTGGYASPLALLYLLQLGAISVFFPSRQLVFLNLWAVMLYTGLMQAYIQNWLSPSYLPRQAESLLGPEFAPMIWVMYLVAMLANWLMIASHSRRVHIAWRGVDAQNQFLDRLHGLTRLGLERGDLPNLYQTLADEIRKILKADAIYFTH